METWIGLFLIFSIPWVSYDYFKYKAKMKALEAKVDQSERVKINEELASVKHRLVVLEKIVTDKGYSLGEEIAAIKSA